MRIAVAASCVRSPVTPSRPTAYTKPRAALDDAQQPLVGGGRCGQHHGLDAGGVGGRAPRRRLVERQVGHDRAAHAALRERMGEAFVAGVEHGVVVGHHRDGHAGVEVGRAGEDRRRRGARGSSASCDACWITGPSITGSENGMPTSTASAPGGRRPSIASIHPARPPVMYGTSSLRPLSRAERSVAFEPTVHGCEPMSIIWATSLSPRPDRLSSTAWPCSSARASHDPGDGVSRFEGGDDAFGAGQQLERVDDLVVGDRLVARPADGWPGSVLRARRRDSRARPRSTRASSTWPCSSCMR